MSLLTVETNMKMHLQMQLLVNLNKTKSPKNVKSPKEFLVGFLFFYFLLLTMVFKNILFTKYYRNQIFSILGKLRMHVLLTTSLSDISQLFYQIMIILKNIKIQDTKFCNAVKPNNPHLKILSCEEQQFGADKC